MRDRDVPQADAAVAEDGRQPLDRHQARRPPPLTESRSKDGVRPFGWALAGGMAVGYVAFLVASR